jgi:hypothetical protein
MTILNEKNIFPPNTLALLKCDVCIGSIIEYRNNRYKVIDIPVIYDGNSVCILDVPIINPVRGDKIKIVKI